MKVLKINSSSNLYNSVTRKQVDAIVEKLAASNDLELTTRDLVSTPPSFVSPEWLGAVFSRESTPEQTEILKESDELVDELLANDVIVLGAPMYNFTVPGVLKAYFDQIARVGRTFRYSDEGMPIGLVEGKKAYVVIATGGTEIGSPYDFSKGYIQTFLGFMGIRDVEFITFDGMMSPAAEEKLAAGEAVIEKI